MKAAGAIKFQDASDSDRTVGIVLYGVLEALQKAVV
jgi:hypothetical protein